MKKFRTVFLIILFAAAGCSTNTENSRPFYPETIDGVDHFSMSDFSREDHFSGSWEAPVLTGKEKRKSRKLGKGPGTIRFTSLKQEKYILDIDFISYDKTAEFLLNGLEYKIEGKKKFLNGENIKTGINNLSFINKKGLRFHNITVYPKRILRIKEYEQLVKNDEVMFLPGSLRFFIKPENKEYIYMKLDLNGSENAELNILLKGENTTKEYQLNIKNKKSFKIDLLKGEYQEVLISIPSMKRGYLKIAESLLVSRSLQNKERQNKKENIQNLAKNKNLLFILLDATRNDKTGYNGYSRETTPNIDKFSKNSLIFNNCYSEASYTLASTGTLLTGLPPDFHGVISSFYSALNKEILTLPELFLKKNYFTGAVSSNPYFGKAYKYDKGFTAFHELFVDHPVVHAEELLGPFRDLLEIRGEKPFFIYLHFREPHEPYEMPHPFLTRFQNRYKKVSGDIPSVFKASRSDYKGDKNIRDILNRLYDGNLAYGDMVFGKVINILSKRKLLSETIIVFLSDHGEALGEHNVYGHGHVLYQQSIRIPLIIKIPGLSGKQYNARVITSDLVRTLADMYELPFSYEKNSYGKNLFSDNRGRRLITRSINAFNYPGYTVQQYPFKLISHFPFREKNIVLFDLKKDPKEENNIKNKIIVKNTLLFYLFNHIRSAKNMKHKITNPKFRKGDIKSLETLGYL